MGNSTAVGRARTSVAGGLGLVILASFALVGCNSAVSQARGSASAAPIHGGTLNVAVTPDAQPSGIFGGYNSNWPWISNVFETLVQINPATLQPVPLLATQWSLASNGKSMNITLRKDVTFQTGRKMTADDVKYSILKAADPKSLSQLGSIARQFSAINVTSPTTLQIDFTNPLSSSTLFDLFSQTPIVDKDTYSGLANGTQVVGTGPYKFASWQPGAGYTLQRYAGYRNPNAAKIQTIHYDVFTNSTAELDAVRSGRDQVAYGLSTTDTHGFAGNPQYKVMNAGGTIYPIGMDVNDPPFNNPSVRQAVDYAINRQRINQQVFQGTGTITDLFWDPKATGYPGSLANQYTYNLAKAKQLMAQAGVGTPTVPLVYMSTPIMDNVFQIVAADLAAIGIKTTGVALDSPTFIARQIKGDLGPLFLSTHGQVGRSATTLLTSLPTLRQGNPSHFWTPEYAQLRTNLVSANTPSASKTALQKLSSYMLEQAFVQSILQAPKQIVVSTKVHNVVVGASGEFDAANAYLTK